LVLFLGIAGLFCVFPASFEAPTKFCIFRRVSGDAPAKLTVAVFRRVSGDAPAKFPVAVFR
jgi:hypothetical protein